MLQYDLTCGTASRQCTYGTQERLSLSQGSQLPQYVEATYVSGRAAIRIANGVKVRRAPVEWMHYYN